MFRLHFHKGLELFEVLQALPFRLQCAYFLYIPQKIINTYDNISCTTCGYGPHGHMSNCLISKGLFVCLPPLLRNSMLYCLPSRYVLQINKFGQGSCYSISFEVHEHSLHLSIQTDNVQTHVHHFSSRIVSS